MRLSQILIQTLREDPSDAEIPSHKLLARAGFIVKTAAGVYTYSPLMWRVVKKFAQIVREELDREGANEVMLPIIRKTATSHVLPGTIEGIKILPSALGDDGGIHGAAIFAKESLAARPRR